MASIASEVKFNFRFEISSLNYPGIHVHVASNGHFHGLCGHDGLQTASEVTSGLRIELSDLKYLCYQAIDLRGFAAGKNGYYRAVEVMVLPRECAKVGVSAGREVLNQLMREWRVGELRVGKKETEETCKMMTS